MTYGAGGRIFADMQGAGLSTFSRITRLALATLLIGAGAASAQEIDTARAFGALNDARLACTGDEGRMWGRSLCGPIALVHPQTRLVVSTDIVAGRGYLRYGDAFVTSLPPAIFIANTSFDWDDRRWTMVAMPLPQDRYARAALVLHEVFHREQEPLGLVGKDPPNNHLDFRAGRTWLRLELRALSAALSATDSAARVHLANALLFRFARRAQYPGSDTLESQLEIQEGLAEYTGHHLAMSITGQPAERVARHVRDFERSGTSFVRGFAYGTGPALGLALDRFAPDWRSAIRRERDLSRILSQALAWRPPRDLVRAARGRADAYGWRDIDSSEANREQIRAPMLKEFTSRFSGRVIAFAQEGLGRGFDPNALIAFDMSSTVYPTGNFTAAWGSLVVAEGGALVRNDFRHLLVGVGTSAIDTLARDVTGPGWKLALNQGWRLGADPVRSGSFRVVRDSVP